MARRGRRTITAHEEFVFEVQAPSVAYGFAVQREKWRSDPYDESQSIEFRAVCLFPDRFKGREAEVRLHGDRKLVQAARQQGPAEPLQGVASVVATKTRFELWAELPSDACWQVGAAMAAGTIRWMLANVPVFQPKHSFINSLSFHGPEFDALGYIG